jgi:5'-methylthioadenosine phosphorylase
MPESVAIAVIGGSGLYKMPELTEITTVAVDTPYGSPSADIVFGTLREKRVAFLPRHGIGHVYTPSTVPYRANIYALKSLGVRFIIAVNACGSLREDYAPGDVVLPDQLVDYTKDERGRTFFEPGLVGHVSVAEPFSPELNEIIANAVETAGGSVHRGGAYITIEGTRFSTRAESHMFRQLGFSIVGMTTCPEAFLAREAEIAYSTMSHVTDYDSWHVAEQPVTVEMVVNTLHRNLQLAQRAVALAVEQIDEAANWPAHFALTSAVMTDPARIPPDVFDRLRPIIGRLYGQA